MATTTNIGLQKFEGSDFVSRDAINENYDKIDEALGIDYVCERGKSGDWEWVKWNSGFMEQWVSDKAFATQTFEDWGDRGTMSRTPNMSFGNFPIAFVSRPLFFVTFNYAEGDSGYYEAAVGYDQSTSVTAPPNFFLIDPRYVGNTIETPHFGCYTRGYWK